MSGIDYEKIGDVIGRVAASEGLELVGWELKGEGKGSMLRIVIDSEQGVTHEDCVAVNNQVGTILDVEDLIPHKYTLEITSPGLGKNLADRAAFDRHRGEVARIRAKEPLDGRTSFKGRIDHVAPDAVTLVDLRGQEHRVPLNQILAANIVQSPVRGRRQTEDGGEQ